MCRTDVLLSIRPTCGSPVYSTVFLYEFKIAVKKLFARTNADKFVPKYRPSVFLVAHAVCYTRSRDNGSNITSDNYAGCYGLIKLQNASRLV